MPDPRRSSGHKPPPTDISKYVAGLSASGTFGILMLWMTLQSLPSWDDLTFAAESAAMMGILGFLLGKALSLKPSPPSPASEPTKEEEIASPILQPKEKSKEKPKNIEPLSEPQDPPIIVNEP